MVEALAIVALLLVILAQHYFADRSLATERARVNDLLRLLEARSAPAEYAAYVDPRPAPVAQGWLASFDGLVVVPEDE